MAHPPRFLSGPSHQTILDTRKGIHVHRRPDFRQSCLQPAGVGKEDVRGRTYPYGKGTTPTMLHRRPRGLEGLWDDLAALHHDNRDGSHASLYYMALRCALTGVDTPSTDMLIRRSCGLNLVFFGLSFLSMTLLLHMLFPGKTMLTTFCLLLAYMNPVSVSNVLQAREYLMAEWLFVLWAYWCLRAAARIHNQQTLWAPGTFYGWACHISRLIVMRILQCLVFRIYPLMPCCV